MTTSYYKDPTDFDFRPDRRRSTRPFSGANRRALESKLTTGEQYGFLRDCLVRREVLRAKLGVSQRLVKHILFLVSGLSILVFFAGSNFAVTFEWLGSKNVLTAKQIAYIAPFIIAYLIVFAYDQARTRVRLGQECQVIDQELQRFGCPTSYSTLANFAEFCKMDKQAYKTMESPRLVTMFYYLRDGVLVVVVLAALIQSFWTAGTTYSLAEHRLAGIGLFGCMAIAGLTAIATPILYVILRRRKQHMFRQYLRKLALSNRRSEELLAEAALGNKNRHGNEP